MAFHAITIMDIWEVLRRLHDGQSISEVAESLGYDRKTIRRYLRIALAKGLSLDTPLPPRDDVHALIWGEGPFTQRRAEAQALLVPYLQELLSLVNDPHVPLIPKSAFEVLLERHPSLAGRASYSSFKRFVRTHPLEFDAERSTCRREVPPGSEVQIDYGRVGLIFDPLAKRRRTLYAFIATLAFSRHKFVELVYTQDQMSFVGSHVRMFDYFGGVPERVVLDNLKAGVIKPDLYEPTFNRSYRELAEHYGCFLDPCRIARPKDKGKVERDVKTVREAVRKILVLHPSESLTGLNRLIRKWCTDEYGTRIHGTTGERPIALFTEREQRALKALPAESFKAAEWKKATVHPDHYIQFKGKTYSIPHVYVGRTVWVRGTEHMVQVFYDDRLIKEHVITKSFRHTDYGDFPENVRAALDDGLHQCILLKAEKVSPHFHAMVRSLLEIHAFVNLRSAQGLLDIAKDLNTDLVDQASAFMIEHRLRVKPELFRQLIEKLQRPTTLTPTIPLSDDSLEFVRDINYFIARKEHCA